MDDDHDAEHAFGNQDLQGMQFADEHVENDGDDGNEDEDEDEDEDDDANSLVGDNWEPRTNPRNIPDCDDIICCFEDPLTAGARHTLKSYMHLLHADADSHNDSSDLIRIKFDDNTKLCRFSKICDWQDDLSRTNANWVCLTLTGPDQKSIDHQFYSSTREDLYHGLNLLFQLPDSYFTTIEIGVAKYSQPLSPSLLEKLICQNSKRTVVFLHMFFTTDQCRVLATAGIKTSIVFRSCSLLYCRREAFSEASATRKSRDMGPAKLVIVNDIDSSYFISSDVILFLVSHGLESLVIKYSREIPLRHFTALIRAGFTKLEIHDAYVDNYFAKDMTDFTSALGENKSLECLVVTMTRNPYGTLLHSAATFARAFAAAIARNKSLKSLGLCWNLIKDDQVRTPLAAALSDQQSIRTLDIADLSDGDNPRVVWTSQTVASRDSAGKVQATQMVADLLSNNTHIENVLFQGVDCYDDSFSGWRFPFDRRHWGKVVTMKLLGNKYKLDWFLPTIKTSSTGAAIMSRALIKLASVASLNNLTVTYMLLTHNCDIVSDYVLSKTAHAADSNVRPSIASRKRSRSPFSNHHE